MTIGKALEGYIQSAGTASFSFRVAERGAYTVETTGYTHVKLALFGPESQTSEVSLGRSTKDLVNQTLVADLNPGTYTVKVKHAQAGGSGEFTVKVTLASHQSVPRDEVAPLPPIQAGKMSKKLALLVGVDKYKAVTDLQGCVNDIKDMKDLLIGNFGFLADDVLELSNEQATHDNIITAFNDHLIQRADEGAIVVFHFSGHGSQMKDAEGGDELFDHLDETLVTHDSRSAPDRFDIRDDELNGLFRQLVAKNTAVTFVLDSCHSGSGIKAAGQGFPRRVDADDRDPPPAKAWELSTKGSKAKDTRFEDLDYVLISGCRAEEVSYELDLNGIRRGALTHYLTKAIRDAGKPAVTYADIMEDVKAQVKSDNPTQNPQVEGKLIKNFVFSDESSQPRRYVRVSRVGNSLRLPVGLVQGMTEDSIFDIYRHDADDMDFDDRQRAATSVKLTKVAAFDSEAELTGDKPVEVADGWKAVLRDVALSSTKFPIYFLKVEDGTGYFVDPSRSVEAIAPNSTLERVRNDLLQNSRLSIVDSGNQARLLFGKVDGHFRVFRPGGIEIAKRADSTKFEDLRDWALGQCRHWSAFHQNLAISNPGTERFRVSLDIEGAQAAQASDVDRVPLQRLNEGAEVRFMVARNRCSSVWLTSTPTEVWKCFGLRMVTASG
ncbi:MAG: caspase family protein [Planctomycetia bacterium]|nr:caspase family protein [Planctomycetia bacterium]